MVVLISAISVVAVAGIAVGLYQVGKSDTDSIDVLKDFKIAKLALGEFKKENINKCDNLLLLKKYMDKELRIDFKRYSITPDQRFFVVNKAGKLDYEKYIDVIGGRSYFENDTLYLSFLKFKVSKVEPVAHIKMFPSKDITTTTTIEWTVDDSTVEDDVIKNVEWKNKEITYNDSGNKTVECRVQDLNENWSEWTNVEFNVNEIIGIKHINAGENYLMITHKSGKVEAIGENQNGQIGTGTQVKVEERKYIDGMNNIDQIACGESHTIMKNYKGQVFGVGSNNYGQLGIGSRINAKSNQKIWGLERVKQIAAGKDFSAAVLVTGAVLTWGQNESGQLGNEKTLYQEIPKRVSKISNVKQVSLGHNHMLCLLYDGTVIAWGDNTFGQIGNGFKGKTTEPSVVEVKNVKYVSAGKNFSIAVLENGKMFGWGNNNVGQLGIIAESTVVFPLEIPKIKNIIKAEAKDSFIIAVNEIGEIFTWGRYNDFDDEFIPTPQQIDGLKYAKDITASYTDAYALLEHDDIITWSSNIDIHTNIDIYTDIDIPQVDEEMLSGIME